MDLTFVDKQASQDNELNYFSVCVDVFSRFAEFKQRKKRSRHLASFAKIYFSKNTQKVLD